jgi:hypothetical protein
VPPRVIKIHIYEDRIEGIKIPIKRTGTRHGGYLQPICQPHNQFRSMLLQKPLTTDSLPLEEVREINIPQSIRLFERDDVLIPI